MNGSKDDAPEPTRRQVLNLLSATTVLALVGCGGESDAGTGATDRSGGAGGSEGPGGAGGTGAADASLSCVVRPQQTEGPYFLDERLNRSDIRSDPTDGSIKGGAELALELGIFRTDGGACIPIEGALVDVWQCDAEGVYAGVVDGAGQFDTTGKKFLRGYQVTDASGLVRFVTIYPGWYTGRAVHIHFKVRLDPESTSGFEFTSQLYFDDALTGEIAALPPYSGRGSSPLPNASDGIFAGAGGEQLLLDAQRDGTRYTARFDLGLEIA